MANYSLVVNSKFNPFTYEELAAPLRELATAHQLLELKLIDLDDLASTLEVLALSSKDRELYNQYKFLADRIKEAADTLATLGLSGVDRGTYLDLKRYHNKVIKPIGIAFNRRATDIANLLKGRSSGMVYEKDAQNASLGEYISNPTLSYANNFADSNAGYKRVLGAANALSKALTNWYPGKKLDKFTNTLLVKHGYNPEDPSKALYDIKDAMANGRNLRGMGVLQDILANELEVSGVVNWEDEAAKNDYISRIASGLYGSVGLTDFKTYADLQAIYNLNHSQPLKGDTFILPSYSDSRVLTGLWASPKAKEDFEKYHKKYFTPEGKLTEEGWEAYTKGDFMVGNYSDTAPHRKPEFRNWVLNTLLADIPTIKNSKGQDSKLVSPKIINEALSKYQESLYDASGRYSYRLPLGRDDGKSLVNKIRASIGENGEVGEVNSIDTKNNKFTTNGTLSYKDLENKTAVWEDYVEGVGRVAVLDNGKVIPVPENIGGVNRNTALKTYSKERKDAGKWLNDPKVQKAALYLQYKSLSGQPFTEEEKVFKNKYLLSYDVFNNLDRVYDLMAPDIQTSNALEILIGHK